MISVVLFAFGLAIGSFINVITARYSSESLMRGFSAHSKSKDGSGAASKKLIIESRGEVNAATLLPQERNNKVNFSANAKDNSAVPLELKNNNIAPSIKRGFFSMVGGRSRCDFCQRQLKWYELVPVLSFLILRGKCRTCGATIPFQYPIVELASGTFLSFGPKPLLAAVIFVLLAISIIDIKKGIIPNWLVAVLAMAGTVKIIFQPDMWGMHLIGGAVGLGFLGAIVLGSRGRAMGMGDVKMAGALGLFLAWPAIILSLFFAFVLGGLWSSALIILGKKKLKDTIAFGPFLALGAVLSLLIGNSVLQLYL